MLNPVATSTPFRNVENGQNNLKNKQSNGGYLNNFQLKKSKSDGHTGTKENVMNREENLISKDHMRIRDPMKISKTISLSSPPKNKVGRRSKPTETKENGEKPKASSMNRKSNDKDKKRDAQKRQQALEAMKLVEQRRFRLQQQPIASIVDYETSFSKLDELAEKKRLEAKQSKEKRILSHLAEQEARKKEKTTESETAKDSKKETQDKNKVKNVKPFRIRSPIAFRPMRPIVYFPDEYLPLDFPPFFARKFSFDHNDGPNIIRYSKEFLKSLNPYGYYFFG